MYAKVMPSLIPIKIPMLLYSLKDCYTSSPKQDKQVNTVHSYHGLATILANPKVLTIYLLILYTVIQFPYRALTIL